MEQLNLDSEDGWQYDSRDKKLESPSLIKFVFRGVEISYQNEKMKREEALLMLQRWFPEASFLDEGSDGKGSK